MYKDNKSVIKIAKSIVGILQAIDKKTLSNLNIADISPYLGTEGTLGGVILELKQDMGIIVELNENCTNNVYFITNLKLLSENHTQEGFIESNGKCDLIHSSKNLTPLKTMRCIESVARKLKLFMSDDEKLQRMLANKGICLN